MAALRSRISYTRLAALGFLLGAAACLLMSGNPWVWLANNRAHAALLKLQAADKVVDQQYYLVAAKAHPFDVVFEASGTAAGLATAIFARRLNPHPRGFLTAVKRDAFDLGAAQVDADAHQQSLSAVEWAVPSVALSQVGSAVRRTVAPSHPRTRNTPLSSSAPSSRPGRGR